MKHWLREPPFLVLMATVMLALWAITSILHRSTSQPNLPECLQLQAVDDVIDCQCKYGFVDREFCNAVGH